MSRGSTLFDPMSLSCLFVLVLVAAMAAMGVRAVRTLNDGLKPGRQVSQVARVAVVSADELR